MRFQMTMMQSADWMAIPAFLEPKTIEPGDEDNPVPGMWHINIFSGKSNTEFERSYKVYVRSAPTSQHHAMEDEETSVVWMQSDLTVPGERITSPLSIINELGNEKGKRTKLDIRTKKLLDKIDNRTWGSLQNR